MTQHSSRLVIKIKLLTSKVHLNLGFMKCGSDVKTPDLFFEPARPHTPENFSK